MGDLIDFYNVQFYNQVDTKYDSYNELFVHSTGFFSNTAVKEIISYGIPANKIVIGKPATPADASNTGWVDIGDLGQWLSRGFDEFGWYTGVMFWQFRNDYQSGTGSLMYQATHNLIKQTEEAGISDRSQNFEPQNMREDPLNDDKTESQIPDRSNRNNYGNS